MGGRRGIERKGQKRTGPSVTFVKHATALDTYVSQGSWWLVPRDQWSEAVHGREKMSWGPMGRTNMTLGDNTK